MTGTADASKPSPRPASRWEDYEAPGSWAAQARCAQDIPPTIHFTDIQTRAAAAAAIAVCTGCPVQARCLEYAERWGLDGVWGGQLLQDGHIRVRRLAATRSVIRTATSAEPGP
jgi:hypothetical protein